MIWSRLVLNFKRFLLSLFFQYKCLPTFFSNFPRITKFLYSGNCQVLHQLNWTQRKHAHTCAPRVYIYGWWTREHTIVAMLPCKFPKINKFWEKKDGSCKESTWNIQLLLIILELLKFPATDLQMSVNSVCLSFKYRWIE